MKRWKIILFSLLIAIFAVTWLFHERIEIGLNMPRHE
jgi:hypothetical protein